jgi:hypothetical protein
MVLLETLLGAWGETMELLMNTASKLLGPHTQTDLERISPVWGSEFTTKAAKKLELIQTQMAQESVLAGRSLRVYGAHELTREEI